MEAIEKRYGGNKTLKNMLRDYYCWLKTYCCWYKLKLLDNAADSRLRLLEEIDESDDDEDDKGEEVHTLNVETKDASVANPPSPSSLPTELKELPSKFNELTKEVKGLKKQVYELEIELPYYLKEIPTKLEDFNKTVTSLTSQVAKLKTLHKITDALNQFAHAIASNKTKDASVPSAGQVGTQPIEGEKNINQTTISQLFQRKAAKDANLTKQKPKPIPPPTTPGIPLPKEEHIKKEKGKKAMSLDDADKEKKENEKFGYVTDGGANIHLTKEKINEQKRIEEDAKVEAAKQEGEKEVVKACPNKTRKGWKSMYEQIRLRMDYIHITKAELVINLDIPLSKQDPVDKLNDLANKKRKHADDIHDYFKANKRLKSSVLYKDHLAGTVLNEPILEEDRLKERNAENEKAKIKDAFDINTGTTRVMKENDINGWDDDETNVQVLHKTNQSIFYVISATKFQFKCFYTFVYAANKGIERRRLWKDLASDSSLNEDERNAITLMLPFITGKLLVRYFGVLLIPKILGVKECGYVEDKIKSKVKN
nr:RNA-directed DNA polymerase, eukaryota, reverse transcriptase zinc-binding domain protein [Tanacetum cinerariifolium]